MDRLGNPGGAARRAAAAGAVLMGPKTLEAGLRGGMEWGGGGGVWGL